MARAPFHSDAPCIPRIFPCHPSASLARACRASLAQAAATVPAAAAPPPGGADGDAPAAESSNFLAAEAALATFSTGSRSLWQTMATKQYDLSQVRESTSLQRAVVGRTPKEPPSGRFSHLLGRFIEAETYQVQTAYERALAGRRGKETSDHLRAIKERVDDSRGR